MATGSIYKDYTHIPAYFNQLLPSEIDIESLFRSVDTNYSLPFKEKEHSLALFGEYNSKNESSLKLQKRSLKRIDSN